MPRTAEERRIFRIKLFRTLAILTVLLVPVLFAIVLRSGRPTYFQMPIVGPRSLQAGDTLVHTVRTDSLVDAKGNALNIAGRQHLLLLISPSCQDTLLRNTLNGLAGTFGYLLASEDDLRIVVVGLRPADTLFSVFTTLAPKLQPLLVGIPYQAATPVFLREGLLETALPPDTSCSPLPYQVLLLDAESRIRAVYPDVRAAYLKRLQEDVRTLRFEQKNPERLLPSQTQPPTLEDAAY